MYAFVDQAIRPSTGAAQCSLAELLDFGPAETFVSHWWGSKVESTLEALERHCEGQDGVRVWICSIANNQRRIGEELGGNIDQSSFSQALHSNHCRAMALMLDDGCETLKRIWCLYEILCVILMRDEHEQHHNKDDDGKLPIRFDLCTPQGILNHGNLPTEAEEIGKLVSAIDVKDAKCSNPQDKVMIDLAIKDHLGSHDMMNYRIRDAVDQSLEKTQAAYHAKIEQVRTRLFAQTDSDAEKRKAVQDVAGLLNPRELLEREREKSRQLEEENGRLREELMQLRQDHTSNLQLRQENAILKEHLRRAQGARKKAQWA
jgi:hypothetical protein